MFERIETMFTTVATEGHGSVAMVLFIGVIFGAIIQFSHAHKFEKIAGFAMLRDTVVPKMLFLAIGIASIGLYFMIQMGYASYHVKPIIVGGLIIGGILFGASMAILGKCPGTGPVSVAEGRIDVLVGSIGGLIGGLVFTLYYDKIKLIMGPDIGKLSAFNIIHLDNSITVLIFGTLLVIASILIPLKEMEEED